VAPLGGNNQDVPNVQMPGDQMVQALAPLAFVQNQAK